MVSVATAAEGAWSRLRRAKGPKTGIPSWAVPACIVAAAAVAFWILTPFAYPTYDFAYAIASGQDILHGRTPAYALDWRTPLPHPLGVFFGVVAAAFGSHAFTVWIAIAALSFGVLVWAVFDLGRLAGGWPCGVASALLVLTAAQIIGLATSTSGDVKFAALVLAAAALEARATRRGWPVLVLLGGAGLLRPEAWLLSIAYFAYVAPRRRWQDRGVLAVLALAGPALWVMSDWLLTGDPLWARTHSMEYSEVSSNYGKGPARVSAVPAVIGGSLAAVVGSVVSWGALGGALVALWQRRRPQLVVVSVWALPLAAMAALILADATVLKRFFVLPASASAVLFSLAAVGWIVAWIRFRGAGVRQLAPLVAWTLVGIALVGATAASAPERMSEVRKSRDRDLHRQRQLEGVRSFAIAPTVSNLIATCRPLHVPDPGLRPYLRFWLDVPPTDVVGELGPKFPHPRGAVLSDIRVTARRVRETKATAGRRALAERQGRIASWVADGSLVRVAGAGRWSLFYPKRCAG